LQGLYQVLLAAGWVYLANYVAIVTGGLLHHPFTFHLTILLLSQNMIDMNFKTISDYHKCYALLNTKYTQAVYSLLHLPLGYPSHLLDGTLPCCSPDFPLIKATICYTQMVL